VLGTSTDRVWLITGSSSGVGRALARRVLEAGHRVVATSRSVAAIRDLEQRYPRHAMATELDVTDPEQARAAMEAAVERFGRLDVVVSNAGLGLFGALEDLAEEELRREFETNVFGAVNTIRAALPQLRAQRSGLIVQISSLEGVAPAVAGESAYAATKFAVEGLCEGLAHDVAHLGIEVMIVEPGPIRTRFGERAVANPPRDPDYQESVGGALEWFAGLDGRQPNDPDRVADAIVTAVDSPDRPRRLALGVEALEAIRGKLAAHNHDLDRWEALSRSVAVGA
jgi:NAD(P)-dependent dehydrogenase (short-subunit alcohol dehydrogenase family)